MTEAKDGVYIFKPNRHTKRVEVFKGVRGQDVFVGSMGQNPSEALKREMAKRIEAEVKSI